MKTPAAANETAEGAMPMVHPELDYDIPVRPLVWTWLLSAFAMLGVGVWYYHLAVMAIFVVIMLVWINLYSTVLHYALDAEEFAQWKVVGKAFVRFQSHHFPKWINAIHRKPVLDLVGELNPVAVLNLVAPVVLFRMHSREVFVAWGVLMLSGGYAMVCHRWAHAPVKPKVAMALQRAHLALSPTEHWAHHAQAVNPRGGMVQNYDLSFGWTNGFFNQVLKVVPSARVWLGFIAVTTFTQVAVFAQLLRWLRR